MFLSYTITLITHSHPGTYWSNKNPFLAMLVTYDNQVYTPAVQELMAWKVKEMAFNKFRQLLSIKNSLYIWNTLKINMLYTCSYQTLQRIFGINKNYMYSKFINNIFMELFEFKNVIQPCYSQMLYLAWNNRVLS